MKIRIIALTALIVSLPFHVEAGSVTDQLKDTLKELITVLNDPTLKAQGKERQREETLHRILKTRFDETAFAKEALRNHWEKITPPERQEFIRLFSALLERTYFERIDAQIDKTGNVSIEDIHYIQEIVKGDDAQVSTVIKSDDGGEIPVIYRLKQTDGNWLVTDMKIEGVIITKNYRAQFDEILTRQPMSELIKKLAAKHGTEQ